MASPLENLSGPGRALQKEAPDAKEFSGLTALARLTDSAKNSNSLESLDCAINRQELDILQSIGAGITSGNADLLAIIVDAERVNRVHTLNGPQ